MLFLALYGDNLNIGEALFISGFSMLVVFFVLLIISYLIDLTAALINKSKKQVTKPASNVEIKNEIKSDDTVVIAAVIAAYLGTSTDNIIIKSIRRINQSDSAWAEHGLLSQIR